jgi:uncharacterized protein involved in copper resistance
MGAVVPSCESHAVMAHGEMSHADMALAGMSHEGMDMPESTPEQAPCDHDASAAACASMMTCTTLSATTDVREPSFIAYANGDLAIGSVATPSSLSPSPDTPPPRA